MTASLEAQLRRVDALNHFALAATTASTEGAVLFAAIDMLWGLLPLSGAVAVMHAEGGLNAVLVRSDAGVSISEPDDDELLLDAIAQTNAPEEIEMLADRAQQTSIPLVRWLDACHPGLDDADGGLQRSIVVLRLSGGIGLPPGVLVLRSETRARDPEIAAPDALAFLLLARKHLDAALATARARLDLERRVEQRTHELGAANAELGQRLVELRGMQRQLLEASRKAGMADVATSVLHNVGNVLNSVNVSAELMTQLTRASRGYGLEKAVALLCAQPDRARFLTEDPRGVRFVDYCVALSDALAEERTHTLEELDSLTKNIDHIKAIVSTQQSLAKGGGTVDEVSLPEILEGAIKMNFIGEGETISIDRHFAALPAVTVDRHKLLLILMNLLSNARHAIRPGSQLPRISIATRALDGDRIAIEVADNGVGIPAENLTKIFTHGFTTKPEGHGFGLHSSACAALELGGKLTVQSDGVGRGSRFTVVFPRAPAAAPGR